MVGGVHDNEKRCRSPVVARERTIHSFAPLTPFIRAHAGAGSIFQVAPDKKHATGSEKKWDK